jgi:hypothetical protein
MAARPVDAARDGDTAVSPEEAIRALDALGSDPEANHTKADNILLQVVPPDVAAAYMRAMGRWGQWYA